jgi:hypothetical protein
MVIQNMIKRILLFVVIVVASLFFVFPEMNQHVSVSVFAFFAISIGLWNFPKLARKFHGRPAFIEDIAVSSKHDTDSELFMKQWDVLMNICFALMAIGAVNYLKFKIEREDNLWEGICLLFSVLVSINTVQNKLGSRLLKHFRKLRQELYPSSHEMVEIVVIRSTDSSFAEVKSFSRVQDSVSAVLTHDQTS